MHSSLTKKEILGIKKLKETKKAEAGKRSEERKPNLDTEIATE